MIASSVLCIASKAGFGFDPVVIAPSKGVQTWRYLAEEITRMEVAIWMSERLVWAVW